MSPTDLSQDEPSSIQDLSISTHVLDAALGRPAAEVAVVLERRENGGWIECDRGQTNTDGRIGSFTGLTGTESNPGDIAENLCYRITFDTGAYFSATGQVGFYPEVSISFTVSRGGHYHVPVLLSPFAYSTYRGS